MTAGTLRTRPVRHEGADRDLQAAEQAAAALLRALGISLTGESLIDTPGRMARAYAELLTPRDFDLRTFEIRAYPTQPIEGLRPGMSVYTDWAEQRP